MKLIRQFLGEGVNNIVGSEVIDTMEVNDKFKGNSS